MGRILNTLAIGSILTISSLTMGADKVQHRFLKAGVGAKNIAVVSEAGKVEWSTPCIGETSDAWMLPGGDVVFSFDNFGLNNHAKKKGKKVSGPSEAGVICMSSDSKVLWKYTSKEGRTNHSCFPLPHKGFLLGEASDKAAYMVEIDHKGSFIKEVKLKGLAVKDKTHTLRQVRKTAEGTYIGTNMKENKTYEWGSNGEVIRTFPNGTYVALRLPNGNTLTSGKPGKTGMVTEFDKDGSVVWEFTAEDAEKLDIQVGMSCGVQRLANGNTVISSIKHKPYIGSKDKKKLVKIIEVTPSKELVWKITNKKLFNTGVIQILNVKGDVYKGEVLR